MRVRCVRMMWVMGMMRVGARGVAGSGACASDSDGTCAQGRRLRAPRGAGAEVRRPRTGRRAGRARSARREGAPLPREGGAVAVRPRGGAPLPREGGAAAGGRAAGRTTTTPVGGGRADGANSHESRRGGAPLPAEGGRCRGHAGSAGGRQEATRVRSPPGDRTTVKAAVRSTTSGGERRLTGRTTT